MSISPIAPVSPLQKSGDLIENDLGDSEFTAEHEIKSTWREDVMIRDAEQQTIPLKTIDVPCQTTETSSISVQTDPPPSVSLDPSATLPGECIEFIKRSAPVIESQLMANLSSHAFDDYAASWEDERETSNLVTLSKNEIDRITNKERRVSGCSDVCWNSNGSYLGVSYGYSDHSGWCCHRSSICIWNIMRRQIRVNTPDIEIELSSCVTCIAFHPDLPTIIAGGTFNGTICVWDISNTEEPLLLQTESTTSSTSASSLPQQSSSTTPQQQQSLEIQRDSSVLHPDVFHREPVSSLYWLRDVRDRSTYTLVSSSTDGKVLFWAMENGFMYPVEGALLQPSSKYSGHHSLSGSSDNGSLSMNMNMSISNRFPVLGITSMNFSIDHSTYIVGSECGGVLKGMMSTSLSSSKKKKSLLKSGDLKWTSDAFRIYEMANPMHKQELKRCIEKHAKIHGLTQVDVSDVYASRPPIHVLYNNVTNFAYECHEGPVYGIHFNPFHRNLFITCSTDQTIRLFHTLTPKPLLTLEPGTGTGSSYLYDVAWSPVRPLVFVVCDGTGKLYVFDLLESMLGPVLTIPANTDKQSIVSISFNIKDPSLLASCDEAGRICVWQLSPKLCSLQKGELQLLDKMGEIGTQENIQ